MPLTLPRNLVTRCAAASLVVAAMVASTGGSAGAAKPAPKPVVLTADQIKAALLTLADLPPDAGFQTFPGVSDSPLTANTTGGICDLPNEVAVAQQTGSTASEGVFFLNANSDGPLMSEAVYSFPSNAVAKQFLKSISAQGKTCQNSWQASVTGQPYDTETIPWTLAPLAFKKVGDQVYSSHVVGQQTDPVQTRVIDSAYVRVGNNVISTQRFGLSNVMTAPSDQLPTSVQKAMARLAAAVRQAKSGAITTTT